MSTTISRPIPRYRAKLARPLPAPANCANSSQVRRLIRMAMSPTHAPRTNWSMVHRYSVLAVILLLGTLAAMLLGSRAADEPTPAVPKSRFVTTFILNGQEPRTTRHEALGIVQSAKRSELGFVQSGRLRELHVKEGQRVDSGTLLAEMDTSVLQSELEISKLELRGAESRLPTTVRSSGSSLAATKAAVDHWRSVVKQLELKLKQSRIYAPFAGIVTHTYLSEGSAVAANRPVLRMVADRELAIRASVPVELAEQLSQDAEVEITAGDRNVTGTLTTVLPDVDPSTQTREALFEVTELPPSTLGTAARLRIELPTAEHGFRVPRTALQTNKDGRTCVYVIRSHATQAGTRPKAILHRENVEVVGSKNGWLLVKGNVAMGDRILAVLRKDVTAGQEVRYSDFAQWRQETWIGLNH